MSEDTERYDEDINDEEVEHEWRDSEYCIGIEEGDVYEFGEDSIYTGMYAKVMNKRDDDGALDVKVLEHPSDDESVVAKDTIEVPCIQITEYGMLDEVEVDDFSELERKTREHARWLADMVYERDDSWVRKQTDKLEEALLSGGSIGEDSKYSFQSAVTDGAEKVIIRKEDGEDVETVLGNTDDVIEYDVNTVYDKLSSEFDGIVKSRDMWKGKYYALLVGGADDIYSDCEGVIVQGDEDNIVIKVNDSADGNWVMSGRRDNAVKLCEKFIEEVKERR